MGKRKILEEIFKRVSFGVWGLCASGIFIVTSIIAAINYVGRDGEPYNLLNHFVSELGEIGISPLAALFNIGLIFNGILLIVYIIGLGLFFDSIIGTIATFVGISSAIACSAVGIYPMNYVEQHGIAAGSFFVLAMSAVIIFSLAIYFQKWEKVPKNFSFLGILAAGFFVALISSITIELPYSLSNRPEVWLHPLLEWAAMCAVIGWVMFSSIYNVLTHYNYNRLIAYTQKFQEKFLNTLRINLKLKKKISKELSVHEAQKIGEIRGELAPNECIICGKMANNARGLKIHQSKLHKHEKVKIVV